ncbi:hypothetical protein [Tardiphaga sp.]|uniref:hypothetical protein n=1 Tax=Tardiphaga sp. TaxID=1926292 RepID=UPI002625C90D|nr:hypothetical protein [Tardiphaga sp.]MDB5619557.1 hypothetical protein [Tardiphaga sp.]
MIGRRDDMNWMIKLTLQSLAILGLFLASPASAQFLPPGGAILTPPPPAAPPPPSMAIPVVPKLDAPPSRQNTPSSRRSFGDRITDCLQDGVSAGLGPNDRAAYSRSCANR